MARARQAEQAGFASLGTIDRIAYPSYESLIALAAAAAVTERIRLVTDILIAPLRTNAALLAKQAATIDQLSSGRLELGLAVGGRHDDHEISGADFSTRGKVFDRQLEDLVRLWSGEGGACPPPAGGRQRPGLLIGGHTEAAFRRAARHADGWTLGGGTPDALRGGRAELHECRQAAGRDGAPAHMRCFASRSASVPRRRRGRASATTARGWATTPTRSLAGAATDADTIKAYPSADPRVAGHPQLASSSPGSEEHESRPSLPLEASLPETPSNACRMSLP